MILQSKNSFVAPINEVFFSYQGEGIHAGIAQIFVRFSGCNLRCNYCDTTKALLPTKNTKYYTVTSLYELIIDVYNKNKKNFFKQKPSISFTGGEPLLYSSFLKELLPKLAYKFDIYMETNGTLTKNLKEIYKYCNIVAMDIKFKTACNKDLFKVHKEFLKVCDKKVFVKTVVGNNTTLKEFQKAVNLVYSISKDIKFIIQPNSNDKNIGTKIFQFYNIACQKIKDVRIVPQLHKIFKIK